MLITAPLAPGGFQSLFQGFLPTDLVQAVFDAHGPARRRPPKLPVPDLAKYQNRSPTTVIDPPTSTARALHESWRDDLCAEWVCTVAGTPGTWKQAKPAAVTADPASGTTPTGYLTWNVTDGAVDRHAGSDSWAVSVGENASAEVGSHGAAPTALRANASQAAATATSPA